MNHILHITKKAAWEESLKKGFYAHETLGTEKFIHCSAPDQVLSVANYNFKNHSGLVLLLIDGDKAGSPVKYENLEGGTRLFPHVYGRIKTEAVIAVADFAADGSGIFRMPEKIKSIIEKEGTAKKSVVKLRDFNVFAIYASDFERSFDFYTNVLGMVKSRDMGSGVLLDAADGQLTVYLEGGKKKIAADSDAPSACMCFQPEEGVRAAYEALKKHGVTMAGEYMEMGPDFHMFACADPDGLLIEFAGRP